jgi:cytochrome c oxidase assembly protein subunit 15
MAGLKAGAAAPTWPTMNNVWWPANIRHHGDRYFPGISFLYDHPLMIHFIHRNLAYLLTILIIGWTWKAFHFKGTQLFNRARWIPLIIVLLQVLLGILTVVNAINPGQFLWLAVAHQFMAMLFLLSLFFLLYINRSAKAGNR